MQTAGRRLARSGMDSGARRCTPASNDGTAQSPSGAVRDIRSANGIRRLVSASISARGWGWTLQRTGPTRTSSRRATPSSRSRSESTTSRRQPLHPRKSGKVRTNRGSKLDDGLAHVEGFRVTRSRTAFHAAKPHQPHECLCGKPVLVALCAEGVVEVFHLQIADRFIEWHETVGGTEVAVELWDLVLENQMIPERVPCEIGQYPV